MIKVALLILPISLLGCELIDELDNTENDKTCSILLEDSCNNTDSCHWKKHFKVSPDKNNICIIDTSTEHGFCALGSKDKPQNNAGTFYYKEISPTEYYMIYFASGEHIDDTWTFSENNFPCKIMRQEIEITPDRR